MYTPPLSKNNGTYTYYIYYYIIRNNIEKNKQKNHTHKNDNDYYYCVARMLHDNSSTTAVRAEQRNSTVRASPLRLSRLLSHARGTKTIIKNI